MSYSDFTLQEVARSLGVTTAEADLLPGASPAKVPSWLPATLARGTRLAFVSEKARSEFIVAPILLAARELSGDQIAIFSGERLDVDPGRGLVGETDFILAVCPPVMPLRAPIAVIVEAKKNDIEGGLGQCVAQMIAARLFNEAEGRTGTPLYGCVTTGKEWQFLQLNASVALLDRTSCFLDNLPGILGALQAIVGDAVRAAQPAA
jgi:hypothetical protein